MIYSIKRPEFIFLALYCATKFNKVDYAVVYGEFLYQAGSRVGIQLFNWLRWLALAANMRKMRIDTIRLKLLKVAAKVVRSARYKYFNGSHEVSLHKMYFPDSNEELNALETSFVWSSFYN